jgi:hypothetical protein
MHSFIGATDDLKKRMSGSDAEALVLCNQYLMEIGKIGRAYQD